MHAAILSWVLFGAWFAPPASAPITAVNVAIISPSEYSAMVMSNVPPEVNVNAEKIEKNQAMLETLPVLPKEEQPLIRTSVLMQVIESEAPETRPLKPEPIAITTPQITEDLPILTTPSENIFALLKSPKIFVSPHKADRIAPIAVAPLLSELSIDEQMQDTVLPNDKDDRSEDLKEHREIEINEKAEPETATQITPEISEELPMSDEIALRPQARSEVPEMPLLSLDLQETEPELNRSEVKDDEKAKKEEMGAPDTSLRPKARPESDLAMVQNDKSSAAFETNEAQSIINAQVRDAISNMAEQNLVSELTPQQESIVRATVKSAIKPYWIVDPGSPASNVKLTLRLEFNKNGKVKEESIKLISSEGGNDKAVRRALRAAKTAVKRASLKGAFALPEETFDGWKILELEFDPEEMRKR